MSELDELHRQIRRGWRITTGLMLAFSVGLLAFAYVVEPRWASVTIAAAGGSFMAICIGDLRYMRAHPLEKSGQVDMRHAQAFFDAIQRRAKPFSDE